MNITITPKIAKKLNIDKSVTKIYARLSIPALKDIEIKQFMPDIRVTVMENCIVGEWINEPQSIKLREDVYKYNGRISYEEESIDRRCGKIEPDMILVKIYHYNKE